MLPLLDLSCGDLSLDLECEWWLCFSMAPLLKPLKSKLSLKDEPKIEFKDDIHVMKKYSQGHEVCNELRIS